MLISAPSANAQMSGLVSANDYPIEALRSDHQGTVGFTLTIAKDGRVKKCRVTKSSGFRELDRATCNIMRERARFTPALDADGNPVEDTYSSVLTWALH
jgi:protein TonB